MDNSQFRDCGKRIVDFIADYIETIRQRRVLPDVRTGFIKSLIPSCPPATAEPWQDVYNDIERVIMPGMTNWLSPNFFAYYPLGGSFPSTCGEILTAGLCCAGPSWASCPSLTELETMVVRWLGQALNLPDVFLNHIKGPGGGIIQPQASHGTLIAFFAARQRKIGEIKAKSKKDVCCVETFVMYASDQSHSHVERSALLAVVQVHVVKTKADLSMDEKDLNNAIKKDRRRGLHPILVVLTLGTTNTCAFDNIPPIANICEKNKLWLHVDSAYAGAALICPEFRDLAKGLENADSFVLNPYKWMLVNFDYSVMWVKDLEEIAAFCYIDPIYLKFEAMGDENFDYKLWRMPYTRNFRSLKMWFVLRMYGVQGLQKYIRNHVALAKEFEKMVMGDSQFEILYPVKLSAVCFRLKASNDTNEALLTKLNQRGRIHLISTKVKDKVIIRFVPNSEYTKITDIKNAWKEIQTVAMEVME